MNKLIKSLIVVLSTFAIWFGVGHSSKKATLTESAAVAPLVSAKAVNVAAMPLKITDFISFSLKVFYSKMSSAFFPDGVLQFTFTANYHIAPSIPKVI